MKYYKLKLSTKPEVIGKVFPQISRVKDASNYDRDTSNSIYTAGVWGEVKVDLNVPDYLLHYHSKRTSFLSFHATQFLLIERKLVELFENFKLPIKQIFETSIESRKKNYDYFLFYLPENYYQYIDFKRSTFALVPMRGKKNVVVEPDINSLEEFDSWINEYPYLIRSNPKKMKIVAVNIFLNTNLIEYDFFRIIGPVGMSNYFVSERLKNAMQENGFTGVEYIPLDKIGIIVNKPDISQSNDYRVRGC